MSKKTKRIPIDILGPEYGPGTEYLNRFLIPNNYCPGKMIDKFFSKYSLAETGTLLFRAEVICESRRIERDPSHLSVFIQDLSELLIAVYLEHRYNPNDEQLVFVAGEEGRPLS
ncbi:hypothetical protein [Arcticibacter sp.]|jgi:hypothetical protein|uniref:hypothetical protein n=1 Tax=Arcticibacter sp. TaxID=1872630 RepID=UPI00388DA8C7